MFRPSLYGLNRVTAFLGIKNWEWGRKSVQWSDFPSFKFVMDLEGNEKFKSAGKKQFERLNW